jgi:uncharacterized protein
MVTKLKDLKMMGMFREIAGFSLLAVGAIGIVVPVIPGIPLLLAGSLLLAPKYPRIRRAMEYIRRKVAEARNCWQSGRQIVDR